MMVLALTGFADSLYLTWYHYDPAVRVCIASSGCETVNASRFATLAGVPVALIGVAGYFLIVAALAGRRWGPPAARTGARYAAYGLSAVGTAFSLHLTAVEVLVLRVYCTWCLISLAMVIGICVVATTDLATTHRS